MAENEPGQQPSLTALPRLEDLPRSGDGYDPDKVREAFESFRRHSAQLQAQLRVLQAASRSGQSVEPTGHAVRMDALHLIRTASEFADTVEADAQKASEAQLSKTEEEVRRRRREAQDREAEIERYRQESERQRAEMLNPARNEARELLANANRDATQELREAEAKGNRLLEQSRHQATELTNSARRGGGSTACFGTGNTQGRGEEAKPGCAGDFRQARGSVRRLGALGRVAGRATAVGFPRACRRLPVPDRGRIHHCGRRDRRNRTAQYLVDHRGGGKCLDHRCDRRDRRLGQAGGRPPAACARVLGAPAGGADVRRSRADSRSRAATRRDAP